MSAKAPKLLSKELMKELGVTNAKDLISKKKSVDTSAKKPSAKQKEREKKKLRKVLDKKAKQEKMKDILSSLQQHKDDIKVQDYDKMLSTKFMGSERRKSFDGKPKPEKQTEEDVDEVDIEQEVQKQPVKQGIIEKPVIEQETREKVEQNYEDMKDIIRQMKRKLQEQLDQQADSDEEEKKKLRDFNEKLTFINKQDRDHFQGKNVVTQVRKESNVIMDDGKSQKDNQLPIVNYEREIMESVENQIVTIVCGETGSGKSTQIPQFIMNATKHNPWKYQNSGATGKLLVGITQPRRVAAVSLAQRVSDEVGSKLGDIVGYQIRYDSEFFSREKTQIKFMTDGILLKEIEADFLLKHYSVIVIDEAHERSLNSDILVSLLTRISEARCEMAYKERKEGKFDTHPLRLIIMSATLRVEDFRENKRLFPNKEPQVIKVEARQFPVSIHYNKVTKDEYVEEAYRKVVKIHKNLPQGGILVFVTGKKEIMYLCKRLSLELNRNAGRLAGQKRQRSESQQSEEMFEDYSMYANEKTEEVLRVQVMPLYSQLNPDKQYKVFQNPKPGHRLIVISTNVAETSVTIPNIRYVIDSGRAKEKVFDKKLQLSQFKVEWISQASAEQRAGRAGRTGPGHCYRLYSSALFSKLDKYSQPEIVKTPLEQTLLQLKSMGVEDLIRFPYVTKPPSIALKAAIRQLCILGALDMDNSQALLNQTSNDIDEYLQSGRDTFQSWKRDPTTINQLGLLLSKIPISPKFGKMLVVSAKYGLLRYAIMIVACMSVSEIFLPQDFKETEIMGDDSEDEDKNSLGTDRDLITSIDVQKKEAQMKSLAKQIREKRMMALHKIKEQRSRWQSDKSDLIMYAKLMSDYFTFVNDKNNEIIDAEDEQQNKIYKYEYLSYEKKRYRFCLENKLQDKAMKEVHFLCLQLQKIFFDQDLGFEENKKYNLASDKISMPTSEQEQVLQQIIISGLCENLARKCPIFDANGNEIKQTNKMKATYESQESQDKLSLHPFSTLYKEKPEFVVYQEIYALQSPDTGKMKYYLKGATKIDNLNWMYNLSSHVLLQTSKPITEQNNSQGNQLDLKLAKAMIAKEKQQLVQYDDAKDQVQVFVRVFYGSQRWPLNIQLVSLSSIKDTLNLEEYYSYFAYALLEGLIFPKIKQLKKYYAGSTREILEKGNISSKVVKIVGQLKIQDIDSKQKLIDKWGNDNPYYMQDSINLWLNEEGKKLLKSKWPPLD